MCYVFYVIIYIIISSCNIQSRWDCYKLLSIFIHNTHNFHSIYMLLYICSAAFTGWDTKNRYVITDIRGNTVFYVAEDSGVCTRLCLGSYRPCEFSILNQDRREVLRMIRPFRCASCCCPCCLQVNVLGFSIVSRDTSGQEMLRKLRILLHIFRQIQKLQNSNFSFNENQVDHYYSATILLAQYLEIKKSLY